MIKLLTYMYLQIKKIPQPCPESSSSSRKHALEPRPESANSDDLRIAWRYNDLPVIDAEQKITNSNYNFDLTNNLSPESLDALNITTLDQSALIGTDASPPEPCFFQNAAYARLLERIRASITVPDESSSSANNLLRISISSLGSPMWFDTEFRRDVCLFLTALKALVRYSMSVCCISMPIHLFKHYVS